MNAVQAATNNGFTKLSNDLLSELKTSYPTWEDLISKTGKFQSSLKVCIQNSSAFIDALQRVADLASKTYGGSREIGTCLTRLCLRQRRLECKLKSMSNHLITSLATPLSGKLEEWRRTLTFLEKDRARQAKRARSDLKRAVAEADRWQKKASKYNSSELGPGVGHGVVPSTLSSGSKANVVATQAANAFREVQIKTEVLESTEKASVRGLMLEERSRFCFFLSCLLPLLECQCSMLSEFSAVEELMQPLSKAMTNPDQLMDDAETILLRASRGELSRASRLGDMKGSTYFPDGVDHGSRLIAAATAALYADHDRNNMCSSDDADSGRLTMETVPMEAKMDDHFDECSISSATHSLPGSSEYAYEKRHNNSSSHINCSDHKLPQGNFPGDLPILSNMTQQRKYSASGAHTGTSLVTSYHLSRCSPQQPDTDDGQFQTLCRPGHIRSSSMGEAKRGSLMQSSQGELNTTLVDGKVTSNCLNDTRPIIDPEWLRTCDRTDSDSDNDDDGDKVDVASDPSSIADDEGGEYVAVQEEVNKYTSRQPTSSLTSDALLTMDAGNLTSGRHTISSAYERGTSSNVRGSINNMAFNPPIGKSSSKDSGVDSSTVLYPNQVLPPPVYTNLPQLAHAAQRKFSMSNLSPAACTPPASPSRATLCCDALTGSSSSNHLVSTRQSNLSTVRQSATHQSVHELSNPRSNSQQMVNMSPRSQMLTRRTTGTPVSTTGSRPCSNGIDPFSVELDELDRIGGTGSSCASSLTMASSTTSESQPSNSSKSMVGNATNVTARRPGSAYDTQWPEHCAPAQHEHHKLVASSMSPVRFGPQQSTTQMAGNDQRMGSTTDCTGQANFVPAQIQGAPSETANLMSELSSQLQQLAVRSVQDPPLTELPSGLTEDGFELPPPPPPSMFQTNPLD